MSVVMSAVPISFVTAMNPAGCAHVMPASCETQKPSVDHARPAPRTNASSRWVDSHLDRRIQVARGGAVVWTTRRCSKPCPSCARVVALPQASLIGVQIQRGAVVGIDRDARVPNVPAMSNAAGVMFFHTPGVKPGGVTGTAPRRHRACCTFQLCRLSEPRRCPRLRPCRPFRRRLGCSFRSCRPCRRSQRPRRRCPRFRAPSRRLRRCPGCSGRWRPFRFHRFPARSVGGARLAIARAAATGQHRKTNKCHSAVRNAHLRPPSGDAQRASLPSP